ncbi:sulfotransferase family protein [Aurantiacibacter suaedae]|uniref:sulfotransferase family protein n=1 Tax=Aurantiacibacter suaedae TaxID=2545755 RepID=UPI0010F983DB|nr:sulfotransferase family protein [Aurantiacibacter suaedae]
MTLQVIGAALPRTGTLSLKFALEMLGIGRCYHMTEFIVDPQTRWRWTFARARPALLDPLWESFSATVDAPGCMMWRPLARRFPEAKVILTRRDPDRWFESVRQTVGKPEHLRTLLGSPLGPALIAQNPFGYRFDRAAMTAHFEAYGARVRETIAPERLLEFEAKDGWEPLCAFLGLPVPDVAFPHVNDRTAMFTTEPGSGDTLSLPFADIQREVESYMEVERQRLLAE